MSPEPIDTGRESIRDNNRVRPNEHPGGRGFVGGIHNSFGAGNVVLLKTPLHLRTLQPVTENDIRLQERKNKFRYDVTFIVLLFLVVPALIVISNCTDERISTKENNATQPSTDQKSDAASR